MTEDYPEIIRRIELIVATWYRCLHNSHCLFNANWIFALQNQIKFTNLKCHHCRHHNLQAEDPDKYHHELKLLKTNFHHFHFFHHKSWVFFIKSPVKNSKCFVWKPFAPKESRAFWICLGTTVTGFENCPFGSRTAMTFCESKSNLFNVAAEAKS